MALATAACPAEAGLVPRPSHAKAVKAWGRGYVKLSFCGELKTVTTLQLNIFSRIPMLILFGSSNAFY